MLAYVLALVIGLGSFAFYMAAFFFPEVHRKSDFYLSGGGLFYALVLWVCAGRITGWVLLSQMASVSLLCWLGWQTLTLRRVLTSPEQQTPIPSQEQLAPQFQGVLQPVTNLLGNLLGKSKPAIPTPKAPVGKSKDTTTAQKEPIREEEVQETTEVEVPAEEETTLEPFPETVAEAEPESEVPVEEEEINLESSPEAVAEVAQQPEVPVEQETSLEPSPETVMEASEPATAPTTYQEKPGENLSSTKKQGLVQQVTGLFKGFLGKSKPATTIPQRRVDTAVSSTAEITMEAELEPESPVEDAFTEEITEAPEPTVSEIKSETPVLDDTEITEVAEPVAAESSEVDISETVELIPPKAPLPELLENQEKSVSSDASESEKKVTTKIEEIAPEVELAPPAEPLGDGDPQARNLEKGSFGAGNKGEKPTE